MASRKEFGMSFKIDGKITGAYSTAFKSATQQLAQMQNELQALNRLQNDISSYQKQQVELEGTRSRLAVLQQQYDNIQQEIDKTKESDSDLKNELLDKQLQIDKTTTAIGKQEISLRQMGAELERNGINTSNLTGESRRLEAEYKSLQKKQEEAADAFREGGESAGLFGEESVSAVDTVTSVLAAAGITKMLQEISEAYMECVHAAGDFEEGMSNVEALSGANAAEMAQLSELAKELGATTKFTALEASDAMGYMAMAGWKADEMLSGMDGVMQLAAASGEDLSTVSDIVTDSLTAFGLKASDTSRYADILASAATNANTNVSLMGETFKYAAPLAGALGYSVEDVATMIGLMANAGIKGSQSGTALRNIFSKLTDGAVLTSDAFGEITVETQNADGSMKGLSDIISELRARFAEMTESEKIANAEALVGERAMTGFVTLMNAADGDFESLQSTITDCSGAAAKMADIKLDNMNGQLVLMQSAWDAVKVSIGEEFSPTMRDVYKLLTEAGNQVNEFVKAHPNVVKAIVAVAGGVGVFSAALAGYKAVTVAAEAVTKLLNLTMMENPAFLVAAGIAAAVTAISAFVAFASEANAEVEEMTQAAQSLNDTLAETTASFENTLSQTNATADVADRYIDKLEELEATGLNTKEQQEEYHTVLTMLCQTVPDLAESIDLENDSIKGGTAALRENTEAWKLNAIEQAKQERLAEVTKAYTEAQIEQQENQVKLSQATEDLKIAQDGLTAAQERQQTVVDEIQSLQWDESKSAEAKQAQLKKLQQEYDDLDVEISGYVKTIEIASAEQQNANEAIAISESALSQAEEQMELTQSAVESLTEEEEDLVEKNEEIATSATELNDSLQASMDKAQELGEAYQKAYEDAYSGISGSFGLFESVSLEVETSVSDMIAALDSQAEYISNYTANLQTAKGMGLSDALISALSDGSQESAAYLQEIVRNGGDKIQELNDKFAKVEEGKSKFADTVSEMQTNFSKEMDDLVSKLESTVDEMNLQEEAAQSGYSTIQGFIDAATDPNMLAKVSSAYSALAERASAAISTNTVSSDPATRRYGTMVPVTGHYAVGTQNAAPGFAEVGENGPELVFFNGGEKVLTAEETEALKSGQGTPFADNIIDFSAAAALYNSRHPESADEISVEPAGSGERYQIVVNPVYNISTADDGEDLETKLQRHDERLVDFLRELMEEIDDDNRRQRFS